MSYSTHASNINTKVNELESIYSSISSIDMDSIWEGKAHDKQSINKENLLKELKNQISYCKSLASALELIDGYDNAQSSVETYSKKLANLNTQDKNYQTNYNTYRSYYNDAVNKRDNYKQQIDAYLNSIPSTSYSSQISIITPVDVVSTVDIYKETINLSSKISTSLDMKSIVLASIKPKIGDPDFSNTDAWQTKNPYAGRNTGQCTWFAWGRFYEIYGYSPGFTGNGNDCAGQLLRKHPDKFVKSTDPVPGAVFSIGLNEQYGHVGIVLDVDYENDKIWIQDGNYNGTSDSFEVAKKDWGVREYSLSKFKTMRGQAVFANPIGGVA